jgi:hypothetical protein
MDLPLIPHPAMVLRTRYYQLQSDIIGSGLLPFIKDEPHKDSLMAAIKEELDALTKILEEEDLNEMYKKVNDNVNSAEWKTVSDIEWINEYLRNTYRMIYRFKDDNYDL